MSRWHYKRELCLISLETLPEVWHTYATIMARRRNTVRTITLTVSTTPPVEAYLLKLVSTGLFGKTTAEAAERLIARAIEELFREGILKRRG